MKAYEGNKPYIFVSYAHKDSDTVLPILEALSEAGYRIWYDAGIQVGTEWPEYIADKLAESACVIAFISKAALASQNCRREINFAISENKEMISVYLEEVELSRGMKMQLGTTQGVYYTRMPYSAFIECLKGTNLLAACRTVTVRSTPASVPERSPTPLSHFEIKDGVLSRYLGGDQQVVIPDGVRSIGKHAFSIRPSPSEVIVSDSVTSIDEEAFRFCENLTSIVIPDSVKNIGTGAFCDCTNLREVTISSGVTSIGTYVFDGCTNLTDIRVALGNRVYYSQNNCVMERLTNKLIYGGKTSVIPAGVTEIDSFAFSGRGVLTAITVPESVTKIGVMAFSGCDNLSEIYVALGNRVYESKGNCILLKDKNRSLVVGCKGSVIPYGVKWIYPRAFFMCKTLTSLVIPDSVQYIGDMAFYQCTSLKRIVIPESVQMMTMYAFKDCENLTVYCKAKSKPDGWATGWNPDNRPVVWGYKG